MIVIQFVGRGVCRSTEGNVDVSACEYGQRPMWTVKTELGLLFDSLLSSISGQNTSAIVCVSNLLSLKKEKKKVRFADEVLFIQKSS